MAAYEGVLVTRVYDTPTYIQYVKHTYVCTYVQIHTYTHTHTHTRTLAQAGMHECSCTYKHTMYSLHTQHHLKGSENEPITLTLHPALGYVVGK